MSIQNQLEPDDCIVTATPWRDHVIIVSKKGRLFLITYMSIGDYTIREI